jgi:hypothetical protein
MRVVDKAFDQLTVVGETITDWIDLSQHQGFSVHAVWDVNTPSASAFTTDFAEDAELLTTAGAHGFTTGLKGQASTTDTLPDPLALTTDYFVIVESATTFKLATTLANALAGVAITLLDDGVGTHTFTPTALAGGVVKVQYANNKDDAKDLASITSNVTADGSVIWNVADVFYKWVRIHSTATAGRYLLDLNFVAKGTSV